MALEVHLSGHIQRHLGWRQRERRTLGLPTIALLSWPLIALVIFSKRATVPAILSATTLSYLFLPEAFAINLPGLPDLNKTATVSVGLLLGLMFFGRRYVKDGTEPTLVIGSRLFRLLLGALAATIVIGTILTVLNNREFIVVGPLFLPGLRPWDAIGSLGDLALILAPYVIARKYLATPDTHLALLKILVFSGLGYSLLMLVEIRLSPQLHTWIYGYFQHSFGQHIRNGFRPIVFLEHGLWVGFFIFMAMMGAVALWKAEAKQHWLWAAAWIFVILMISKNVGAFVIGLFCLAVFFGLWRKMQLRIIFVIALATLTFPALRQAELLPVYEITAAARNFSEERAQSLEFRLRNEDLLLARAFEKPLTGWGGWSRDRLFNESGREITVSEGYWILTLGKSGWLGYIGMLGLLALPLLFLGLTSRRKDVPPQTVALGLICAGNLIYMIPNATLTPLGLLCFGALSGFAQFDKVTEPVRSVAKQVKGRRSLPYTRFAQTNRREEIG